MDSTDLRSGSKGELDGEAKGGSCLGKVKARGVGERMATVGVSGSSVVVITSSAEAGVDRDERGPSGGGRGRDSLRDAVSRVRRAGMMMSVLVMWVKAAEE